MSAECWRRARRRRRAVDEAPTHAALHYPHWSREQTAAAQLLAAYGREQVTPCWPDEVASDLDLVNKGLVTALGDFTRRWFSDTRSDHRRTVTFAVLDIPSGAIRATPSLADRLPGRWRSRSSPPHARPRRVVLPPGLA